MFGTSRKEKPIEPPWYCETGWPDEEPYTHILDIPFRRKANYIQGFTGEVPKSKDILGECILSNLKKSYDKTENSNISVHRKQNIDKSNGSFDLKIYRQKMNIVEKYNNAIAWIEAEGRSQKTLLKISQSKVSEKRNVNDTADLVSHIKNTFKFFNMGRTENSEYLNEIEFRAILDLLKISFTETQATALFAYYDTEFKG